MRAHRGLQTLMRRNLRPLATSALDRPIEATNTRHNDSQVPSTDPPPPFLARANTILKLAVPMVGR